MEADTDHKLVKMEMKIEWHKIKKATAKSNKIDVRRFTDADKQSIYKSLVQDEITRIQAASSSQEKWSKIYTITKEKGKEALGTRMPSRKVNDANMHNHKRKRQRSLRNQNAL